MPERQNKLEGERKKWKIAVAARVKQVANPSVHKIIAEMTGKFDLTMNNQRIRKSCLIFLAAMFLIVIGCSANDNTSITNVFGGSANAAVIANADSVKAWRTLGSVEEEEHEQGRKAKFDFTDFSLKTGQPILVSTNLATQLSKLLLDKNSYPSGLWQKNCFPEPSVVFTFSQGDKSVDVFFCFECKIMIVKNIPTNFDRSSAAFIRIIKKIFPTDRKIQSVSDDG
jgi:hypothetical protein